jgi:hypothetical protein
MLVTLSIFDSKGTIIDEPIKNDVLSGKHQFTFDCAEWTPGVYYYRFITGELQETRKFVVLR